MHLYKQLLCFYCVINSFCVSAPWDRFMALINYLICAECGFKAAQFNVAYLCEHNLVSNLIIMLFAKWLAKGLTFCNCISEQNM